MILEPNPKLNIGLNVLGKRPDGYHDLETLFVPWFGVKDVLEIEESGEGRGVVDIEITGPSFDWDARRDLTVRAYELLDADFHLPSVRMKLQKNIPVGAGLGGGSADAAFTLRALSEMFALGLSDESLAGYASVLGADCAFFIYNRPMFGRGKGDLLEPFDIDLSAFDIRVEIPDGVAVSTKEAYAGIVPHLPSMPLAELLKQSPDKWQGTVVNDFEKSVFAVHPEIEALKRRFLDEGAVYASMSGSGSSVFGLFRAG